MSKGAALSLISPELFAPIVVLKIVFKEKQNKNHRAYGKVA